MGIGYVGDEAGLPDQEQAKWLLEQMGPGGHAYTGVVPLDGSVARRRCV
jgi:hypothetical protein